MTLVRIERRAFLAFAAASLVGRWPASADTQADIEEIHQLKPGQFVWHPERAPQGPVVIIASIPDQLVHVYRNGIRIAVSTCSTGKQGHATPAGVFTILQKDRNHHSSTYNDAPMPFMNRLTWNGVALHAGNLPGYPASHGCVRLPIKFAELLFSVTHIGVPVIVAGASSDPIEVTHPGLVLNTIAEREAQDAVDRLRDVKLPAEAAENNETPPTTGLVSSADRRMFVTEDSDIVAEGAVSIDDPQQPLGTHIFVLRAYQATNETAPAALHWTAVGFHPDSGGQAPDPNENVLARVRPEKAVLDALRSRMHPGMSLMLTDLPANADTRTGKDFVILSHDES